MFLPSLVLSSQMARHCLWNYQCIPMTSFIGCYTLLHVDVSKLSQQHLWLVTPLCSVGKYPPKTFFACSALIMGTLKGSTSDFLISVPKVKILQGAWMDLICPNLPIPSKISVNKKSRYTLHLKEYSTLIIFYQKTWVIWALLLQLCVIKVTDDIIAKKLYISSQNFRNFCLNCSRQVKLWIHSR